MRKRNIAKLALLPLVIWGTCFAGEANQRALTGLERELLVNSLELPNLRIACQMQKHSDTAIAFYSGFDPGDRIVTYFDPAIECSSPTYPFEIQSLSITLFDAGGFQWPVEIDLVVFGLAGADSCGGPGAELCRYSATCDSSVFRTPHVGTISFPSPCCVIGPIFIGFEYSDSGAGPFPSVLFDNHAPVTGCENWGYGVEGWSEWSSFWAPPRPGNPLYWIDGETQSPLCGPACCVGNRGDVNGDGTDANILDLTYTVDRIFRGGAPAACQEEGDVNNDGSPTNILDLTFLVDRIFRGGLPPGPC